MEKEYIGMAYSSGLAISKTTSNKISKYDIQADLDNTIGANKTSVSRCGEEFDILIKDKNYYYNLDEVGNVTGPFDVIETKYPGDITKNGEYDGSESRPYQISCIEDLIAFSNMTNGSGYKYVGTTLTQITSTTNFSDKNIVLTRDLNFESIFSYEDWERNDFGDINGNNEDGNELITEMTTGTGFRPINGFRGKFDGKENELINIYINTEENGALFAECFGAIISNIGITGEIRANKYASEIVAMCAGGKMNNVYNRANIISESMHAGGLIAFDDYTSNSSIYIINSFNEGNISSITSSAGGILGASDTNVYIYNCYNVGDITAPVTGNNWGKGNAGGIVGFQGNGYTAQNITIVNCFSKGSITGQVISGIIGRQIYGTANLINCFYIDTSANRALSNYWGRHILDGAISTEKLQDGTLQQKLNNYCEENKTENLYDEYDYKIWIQEKDYPTLK